MYGMIKGKKYTETQQQKAQLLQTIVKFKIFISAHFQELLHALKAVGAMDLLLWDPSPAIIKLIQEMVRSLKFLTLC